jgi:hypothetical protein
MDCATVSYAIPFLAGILTGATMVLAGVTIYMEKRNG